MSLLAVWAILAGLIPIGAAAPGPAIREESFIRIGGIEQWVTIRGADRHHWRLRPTVELWMRRNP